MDFDEYEYLEKQVEKSESPKAKAASNGSRGREGEEENKEKRRSSKRRDEEVSERENDHRSKRQRSDGNREHDWHRSSPPWDTSNTEHDAERSRRQHRDHHREERNGKERDRGRDKAMERERPHRRYEDERHRHMERSREREFRERDREREPRERDRDARRYKEKKEDGVEPEIDPERDQRTVFAYQITLKADERDVYEFFSRAGKVRDVRLIMDRNSRRSKGVGYIEFYDAMSVPMAIALSGQPLLGQPVMVKPSEAEKNLVQSTAAAGAGGVIGPYSGGARRLYVGNLHFNIKEEQLRQVFEPFGTVELVQLPLDPETGNCKGYGFVQFAKLEDARAAQSLNGQLDIAGKIIKVSPVSDQVGMQEVGASAGDLDDDDGGGLALNARSRALLMEKLGRSDTTTSVAAGLTAPVASSPAATGAPTSILGVPPVAAPPLLPSATALFGMAPPVIPVLSAQAAPIVDPIGLPSECLLLKNMFDPKLETEPDFDLDIKEDVEEECSKFGPVNHIFVDKISAGHVYLRFNDTAAAMNAQRSLHGRWFAGKMITASFLTPQQYGAKFPDN